MSLITVSRAQDDQNQTVSERKRSRTSLRVISPTKTILAVKETAPREQTYKIMNLDPSREDLMKYDFYTRDRTCAPEIKAMLTKISCMSPQIRKA